VNIEQEAQFFDQFEGEHGEYDVLAERSYRRIVAVLEERTHPQPGMRCVDLGCGTGAFTRRLTELKLALTGVDISPRSIERARVLGGAEYVVGNICRCPLPAADYDMAVMSGVLHHICERAMRVESLREAFRLLKAGGYFFSYDPNARSPSMFLYRDPRSPLYSQAGKTANEILLTREELESNLAAAGFMNICVRGLSGIAYRYVESSFARKLLPLYNYLYEPLIRWSPFEKSLGTFLVATAVKP
jgi:ubiquinone/menaquinone biosynthesis C-methylase UbiE